MLGRPPTVAGRHSVIISSYNRPTMVRKAIGSVLDQDYDDLEVIVTDDGSTAETLASIQHAFGSDRRCVLMSLDGHAPAGPRKDWTRRCVRRINDAVKIATGEFFRYLPDDDWFLPGRFQAFDKAFTNQAVVMAYGRAGWMLGPQQAPHKALYPGTPLMNPTGLITHSQVAHRASVFDKIDGWPETDAYAIDAAFWDAAIRAGCGPIWPMDYPVANFWQHDRNMMHTKDAGGPIRE